MPASRLVLCLPVVIAVSVVLAGCVPAEPGASSPTPSSSSEPAGPSATATVPPAPTVAPETGEPVTIGCADLISLQAMYDYNPNFGLIDSYTPDPGTYAAQAIAANGLACRWINQTSGDTIDVSVAHLTDEGLAAREGALSDPVSDYDGYFSSQDGFGTAQAFSGPYWITAASRAFFEPVDAAPIIAAAIAGLG